MQNGETHLVRAYVRLVGGASGSAPWVQLHTVHVRLRYAEFPKSRHVVNQELRIAGRLLWNQVCPGPYSLVSDERGDPRRREECSTSLAERLRVQSIPRARSHAFNLPRTDDPLQQTLRGVLGSVVPLLARNRSVRATISDDDGCGGSSALQTSLRGWRVGSRLPSVVWWLLLL